MLPRPNTVYEIKEVSTMWGTNEDQLCPKINITVVIGSIYYLISLFSCLQVNSTKVREILKPV